MKQRLVALLLLIGLLLTGCGGGEPKAEIVQARVVPFTTADRHAVHMVLIDWKKTGTPPVRIVHASITIYDANGNVFDRAPDYTIYSVSNSDPGIAPGETYREPTAEGYMVLNVLSNPAPVHLEAVITEVSSEGASL